MISRTRTFVSDCVCFLIMSCNWDQSTPGSLSSSMAVLLVASSTKCEVDSFLRDRLIEFLFHCLVYSSKGVTKTDSRACLILSASNRLTIVGLLVGFGGMGLMGGC